MGLRARRRYVVFMYHCFTYMLTYHQGLLLAINMPCDSSICLVFDYYERLFRESYVEFVVFITV